MTLIDHSKAKFRFDINALRALAVMLVVLYHFGIKGFSVGFIGVDVFFVISGYLMTQIIVGMLENNRFDYLKFIFARIKRIWPALIVLVMVLSGLATLLLPSGDLVKFATQAKDALLFISNIEFAKGVGYFTTNVEERWFLHSWSLSVEWQFYCLYPFILLGLWKLIGLATAQQHQRLVLAGTLFILSIVSYSLSVSLTKQNQPLAFFSLGTRAWEMMAGGIVLLLTLTKLGAFCRRYSNVLKCVCVLLFTSCVFLGRGGAWVSVWPGSFALIPVAATALYMLAGSSNRLWQAIENNPMTQALGRWSYSIYLWHWPVVIAINFIGLSEIPYALKICGITLSLLLGFLSFRWVESSFRDTPSGSVALFVKISGIYAVALISVVYLASSVIRATQTTSTNLKTLSFPHAYDNFHLKPDDAIKVFTLNPDLPQKVLVIGDSHAAHLFPWFRVNMTQASVTFAVTNGCPPLPAMNRPDPGWYCHKSFEKIRQLTHQKKYDVIIISGNWYAPDRDRLGSSRPGMCSLSIPHCTERDKSKNQLLAAQALSAFFDELALQHTAVVIVRPTPFAEVAIGRLAERYRRWGWRFPSQFTDQDWQHRVGDSLLDLALKETRNPSMIHSVDLRTMFCKEGVCQYFDKDDKPIFWDDNHFRVEWIVEHGNPLDVVQTLINNN